MSEERKQGLTTQAKVMIALIVLMIIGIIVRWEFIQSEVGTVLDNMFQKKQ